MTVCASLRAEGGAKQKIMKKLLVLIVAAILLLSFTACGGKGRAPYDIEKRTALNKGEQEYAFPARESYENDIEIEGQWGANPYTGADGQYGIGDPFVLRFDGKYYLYPSTSDGNCGIKVFESEDLVHWEYKGFAVPQTEETSRSAYAPEVVYYGGKFYLCQSQGGSGHYIYVSDSPLGEFRRISGNLGKGIDGAFHIGDDGTLYFLHTSTPAGIRYATVISFDESTPTEEMMSVSRAVGDANLGGWIEGPGIIRRGDYTYFTYTGNNVGSRGYRVAYSYTKNFEGDMTSFVQPRDNITFLSTKDDYYGLGHSSNTYGPDLDSIYTAYHNLVGGGPQRRYNLGRYITNGGVLSSNGVTDYPVDAPKGADYSLRGTPAKEGAFYLSDTASASVFTAEYNFTAEGMGTAVFAYLSAENYAGVRLDTQTDELSLICVKDGKEQTLATCTLTANNAYGALNTLRVESGYGCIYVSYNSMRKLVYEGNLGGGKIGYTGGLVPSYTAFSDDAFGTSDFEEVKNLPSEIQAMTYLKGENRGFSFSSAKANADGMRQGEKESSIAVGDSYALVLSGWDDYVKYAVNASETSVYSFGATVSAASAGAVIEVIVDGEEIYPFEIPETGAEKGKYAFVSLGTLPLSAGKHTLKIRLYSGKLEMTSFTLLSDGESISLYENSLTEELGELTAERGTVRVTADGAITSQEGTCLLTYGGAGCADYALSFDVTVNGRGTGNLVAIVLRFSEFSEHSSQVANGYKGYILQIEDKLLTLSRCNYNKETLALQAFSDDSGGAFAAGKTNRFKVVVQDCTIEVYVNGQLAVRVSDADAIPGGKAGLLTQNAEVTVKNFKYEGI